MPSSKTSHWPTRPPWQLPWAVKPVNHARNARRKTANAHKVTVNRAVNVASAVKAAVNAATATAAAMTAVATALKAPRKARTLKEQPPCWTKPATPSPRCKTVNKAARATNSASRANAAAATAMAVTAANVVKTVSAVSNL
jgi:hypothetical protein